MGNELIEATKKAMCYSDNAPACENCIYHSEPEGPHGGWYDECNYSNLQPFSVSKKGACKFFKDKNQTNGTDTTA